MIKRSLEPDYEAVLSLIRHMSNESLREFINNDEKVEEIVKFCEQCKDLETEKELIMAQNRSLAEYNLSLSPKLENGKARLKELCDSVQTTSNSLEEKQSQLKSHSGNLSSDTVLALLQTAAAESEEESEKIADQFYQKEIEMEEFLDQFQAFRKLMHLRRVKADKMNDILSKKKNVTSSTPSAKTSAPSVPYPTTGIPQLYPTAGVPYPTSSTPYPIGGINLPYFPISK